MPAPVWTNTLRTRASRGVTMIEVLIAIVILAFGMMGMLALFLNSLKISSGSVYRNIATQHSYMMADMIRANTTNLQAYFTPTASATTGCFASAGCASTVIPNTEYKLWQTQLTSMLPAGQGVVCRDASASTRSSSSISAFLTCSGSGEMVVKVCWDETRIQAGNAGGVTNAGGTLVTGGAQCIYTAL